jgi:hypothetical protein
MNILDRVIVNGEYEGEKFIKEEGIIIATEERQYVDGGYIYLIAFDNWFQGHSAHSAATQYKEYIKKGNCWWVDGSVLTSKNDDSVNKDNNKYKHIVNKIKSMERKRQEAGYITYQL